MTGINELKVIENKIHSYTYELNTITGLDSFELDKFNGHLESITIIPERTVLIKVSLEDEEVILKRFIQMSERIHLRTELTNKEGEQFNYQSGKYALDDKLTIHIKGQPNTKVKIIIRLS